MNPGRWLRAVYEEHMRIKRDRLYLRRMDIAEEIFGEEVFEGRSKSGRNRCHQDILYLLEDLGEIPQDIRNCVLAEENPEILRRWLKAAAKAENFVAFRERIIGRRAYLEGVAGKNFSEQA